MSSSPNFPEYRAELIALNTALAKHIPDTFAGFRRLHGAAMAEGAVSPKHKELIALGIAIAVQCDGCIGEHVRSALRKGASRQELAETIGVALSMGGGPATVYGALAWKAVEEFAAEAEGAG